MKFSTIGSEPTGMEWSCSGTKIPTWRHSRLETMSIGFVFIQKKVIIGKNRI